MTIVTRKCPKCNETIQLDDSRASCFCMYCGAKIEVADMPKEIVAETPVVNEVYVKELMAKAEAGDIEAQYSIATMYRTGKGLKQSYLDAYEWYKKAADQGDPFAMYNIGILYSCGYGVKQNCVIAERWYAEANKHGLCDRNRAKKD